jgi:hypothetical protein
MHHSSTSSRIIQSVRARRRLGLPRSLRSVSRGRTGHH